MADRAEPGRLAQSAAGLLFVWAAGSVIGPIIMGPLVDWFDVAGMFFFEDNNYVLVKGNPIGARLHKVAKEKGILLMGCDQCCYEREIADILFDGVPIGCFPDLYKALSGNMPDQVITL